MGKLALPELLEKKDLSRRVRRPFERDWYLNMAFIAGEQYVEYAFDPVNRIVELENPDNSIRAMHNICVKIARTERAKILKNRPTPIALPATDSQDDIYAARIVEAYFNYLKDEWNFERRLRNAVYWLVATGNVFFKWYWAANSPRIAVVSPFDVFPDPYARTMQDCRWMMHAQFMDEESAKEMFRGIDKRKLQLDAIRVSSTDTLSPVESRIFSNFGDGTRNLPGVLLNEYWEPPSVSVPRGRHIIFTEHGIVFQGDFPYDHGRMPFTHAGHIERTNAKWHASVMDFVRPLQQELNRVESQIIENRNLANGTWFIPTEVELSQPITAEPRQVIKWEGPPNLNPQDWFVQVQGMANWVGSEPERIKAAAQDIVHQHEVSNASVPGRVESGQAIQLLQETDDSVMKDTIHSLEEAIAEGFLQCAFLFKQLGDAEIVVRAYDKDGMVEVQHLKKDHIQLDMRVKVQTTTGLPQTVAGKWDRVLNLLQYQVITPQRAIELLDLSSEDPELAPDAQDRRNQYRENKMMLQEEIVRPKPWDNHDIHLEEMDKFRKSEEYRRAVAANPLIEEKFNFHEDEHKALRDQRDQENAQREAAMMAALQGAQGGSPGEGGGPPGVTKESGLPQPIPPEPAPNGSPAPVA
jgi:hypothetical protein